MEVGDIVIFGHYEQDNDTANGKEEIEWQVLNVQGDSALLISRFGLDTKPYHTERTSVTWETCSLRSWLNSDFLEEAFGADEQTAILTTAVDNSQSQGNSAWKMSGGIDTQDKVFLLSYQEAGDCFGADSVRVCKPTKYAKANGAYVSTNGNGRWWLRSPGRDSNNAADVDIDGSVHGYGNYVNYDDDAVRPAFRINLESDIIQSVIRKGNTIDSLISEGIEKLETKDLAGAEVAFSMAASFELSKEQLERIKEGWYSAGIILRDSEDWDNAIKAFTEAGDYKDATEQIEQILEDIYQMAERLREAGDYGEAMKLYAEIADYKDVAERIKSLKTISASSWKVGGTVFFGKYEQDNDRANGKEDIAWKILAVEGDKALLISQYGLDARSYHTTSASVTWESCSLRSWLNGEFLNQVFSSKEQGAILTTEIFNHTGQLNPEWSTYGGNKTQDKVFLLSYQEAERYFANDDARMCKPTAYAQANGATVFGEGNCRWWLRSPGENQRRAALVSSNGYLGYGFSVHDVRSVVRPAFWLNLESDTF